MLKQPRAWRVQAQTRLFKMGWELGGQKPEAHSLAVAASCLSGIHRWQEGDSHRLTSRQLKRDLDLRSHT